MDVLLHGSHVFISGEEIACQLITIISLFGGIETCIACPFIKGMFGGTETCTDLYVHITSMDLSA